jgi:hypothetical protein
MEMHARPITWILGSVAAVSAAFSTLVAYLHPSVTFESYRTVALGSLVTNSCLSPWNRWTEHSTSVVTGPLNSFVQGIAITACKAAIGSREHFVIVFSGVAVAAVFGALATPLT